MEELEAYPLQWPVGYKRTDRRKRSLFKTTMDQAQRFLRDEIKRLGGKNLIVSSNIPIRNDGLLYSDWMRRRIDDPGVAIYFVYKGKDISMCCDQYLTVWENIYALGKGIEALRGMERWGVSDFLERAFTGFTALPEKASPSFNAWWDVLGLKKDAGMLEVKVAFRLLAKKLHPDVPGTGDEVKFHQLKGAYEQAIMSLTIDR